MQKTNFKARPLPHDKALAGDKPARQALAGSRLNAFGRYPESLTLLYDSRDPRLASVRESFQQVVAQLAGKPVEKCNYDLFIAGVDIDIATLDEGNPLLELYDQERIYEPLPVQKVKSVMVAGIKLSVPVWKFGEKQAIPVDGRQRTKWGRAANLAMSLRGEEDSELHKVKCTVEYGTEAEMGDLGIMANEIRVETSPAVKAKKAAALAKRNRSEEEIADLFGVSVETVQTWLSFASADRTVQMAAYTGALTLGEAATLADKPVAAQRERAAEATAAVEANGGKKPRKAPTTLSKPKIQKLAQRDELSDETRTVLKLVAGEITLETAYRKVPGLKAALEALKPKKAK